MALKRLEIGGGEGKKNWSSLHLCGPASLSWEQGGWVQRRERRKPVCVSCNCLFILQTFTECLLCARHCASH